jgi:tetratricopeptide (TPR) repeat protein
LLFMGEGIMKMLLRISLALLALAQASGSIAQAMTILGGNSLAFECFRSAQMAARSDKGFVFGGTETCDKALEHGSLRRSDYIGTLVNRGIIYAAGGQLQNAARDYDKAMEMDENIPELRLNRGNLLFQIVHFQEAIDEYNKALELGLSAKEIAYLNRGMALEYLGVLEESENDYLRALEIVPNWEPALEKLERVRGKLRED